MKNDNFDMTRNNKQSTDSDWIERASLNKKIPIRRTFTMQPHHKVRVSRQNSSEKNLVRKLNSGHKITYNVNSIESHTVIEQDEEDQLSD